MKSSYEIPVSNVFIYQFPKGEHTKSEMCTDTAKVYAVFQ